MNKAQIIAAAIADHMTEMRRKGGLAKSSRMTVEQKRAMALRMVEAKREKRKVQNSFRA